MDTVNDEEQFYDAKQSTTPESPVIMTEQEGEGRIVQSIENPHEDELPMTPSLDDDNDDDDRPEKAKMRAGRLRRLAAKHPRYLYTFISVILPMFLVIAMCYIFGIVLAINERPSEIGRNDESLSRQLQLVWTIENIPPLDERTLDGCLADVVESAGQGSVSSVAKRVESNSGVFGENVYEALTNFRTATQNGFISCTIAYAKASEEKDESPFRSDNFTKFYLRLSASTAQELTFNWISCYRLPELEESVFVSQAIPYINRYYDSFNSIYEELLGNGTSPVDAVEVALRDATGGDTCRPHYAGGGLFWFTVITSIGYGNSVPLGDTSRMMIYTVGFLGLIAFTALTGQASYIVLTIADDFFLRRKWFKCFSKGFMSVLLWFLIWFAYCIILGQISEQWIERRRLFGQLTFSDSFWFAFVTLTTIGFGDIYIPPEEFNLKDMLVLPIADLVGFVFLGNFAIKLHDWILYHIPLDTSLEDRLREDRMARGLVVEDDDVNKQQRTTGTGTGAHR